MRDRKDTFVRMIEARLASSPHATLRDCVPDMLGSDIKQWIRESIEGELRGQARPSQEAFSVLLATGQQWQLKANLQTTVPRFLYTSPFELLISPVTGDLIVDEYAIADADGDIGVGTPIFHVERHRLAPGDVLDCSAPGRLHDLRVGRPTLVAKLIGLNREPIQWMAERSPLRIAQAISASPIHSELEIMARTLGALRMGGADALGQLATHESHFVRWAAIQAMGRVEPERAIVLLKEAADDAHPHIRRSASAFLSRMQGHSS